MMKMAIGEGLPPPAGCQNGSRLVSVATEASGGGTPDLMFVLEVLGHVGIYGCGEDVGGAAGVPRDRGRAPTLVSTSCLP